MSVQLHLRHVKMAIRVVLIPLGDKPEGSGEIVMRYLNVQDV